MMSLEVRLALVLVALALFPLSDAIAGIATMTAHPGIVVAGNALMLAGFAGVVLYACQMSRERTRKGPR